MAVRRLAQDDVLLDLIAVMHIGDARAYKALDKRCETYEALLYEHAEGPAEPAPPRDSDDYISRTKPKKQQVNTTQFLGLSDQFEVMAFLKPNYVWADLSREVLHRELTDRGEYSPASVVATQTGSSRTLGDFLDQTEASQTWGLLSQPNGQILFNRSFAQFLTREPRPHDSEHPVIILRRNDKALHVLWEQVCAGKKKLGLLYGAGHMPDLWAKLVERDQWKFVTEEWYTLWDLRDPVEDGKSR